MKKEYSDKGIVENFDLINSVLNDDDKFGQYFDQAIDNLKKVVQNYSGLKKEIVPSTLRKAEFDSRIVKYIKTQK